MSSFKGQRLELAAMQAERERLRAGGRKVVFTNGCFDILHTGHVTYLTAARRLGDVLVVGVNSDRSVQRNKGPLRPIVNEDGRIELLLALRCVDYAILFDEETPLNLITSLVPDILVKGRDWAHNVVGREVVEAAGGRVELADIVAGRSTTNIIERILQTAETARRPVKGV